jgi:hypothetical protein
VVAWVSGDLADFDGLGLAASSLCECSGFGGSLRVGWWQSPCAALLPVPRCSPWLFPSSRQVGWGCAEGAVAAGTLPPGVGAVRSVDDVVGGSARGPIGRSLDGPVGGAVAGAVRDAVGDPVDGPVGGSVDGVPSEAGADGGVLAWAVTTTSVELPPPPTWLSAINPPALPVASAAAMTPSAFTFASAAAVT